MGYDLFGGLFFAALTPLVILGFVVFWVMTNREREYIEDNWETYAARRGREYFPARGEWPNRTSPGVRWVTEHVVYELTAVGVEAGARTRITGRPRERLLGSFTARFEGVSLVVNETHEGLADRVLDGAARRALVGFRQHDDVTVRYRRGRIALEWPGRESNDARLDEAARVAGVLVGAVDDAFHVTALRATG
ncbi:MAG: hypothetical protein U0270_17030 [Labilithrix sp.]